MPSGSRFRPMVRLQGFRFSRVRVRTGQYTKRPLSALIDTVQSDFDSIPLHIETAQHCRHISQSPADVAVIVVGQAQISFPVHPLGFSSRWVRDARHPAQARSELVGRPVGVVIALAAIGQPVTVPTSKDPVTAIQQGHTPPASRRRALPPDTMPAQVAWGVCQPHGIVHVMPLMVNAIWECETRDPLKIDMLFWQITGASHE
jgi:hypothetical protein